MSILFKSHGGSDSIDTARLAPPADGEIAPDEQADFGYFLDPESGDDNYLIESDQTVADLKALGTAMIDFNDKKTQQATDSNNAVDATPDSTLPTVLTYWGQFLDHELTARTDREGNLSQITGSSVSVANPNIIERSLKNSRTPRFDLDSVYGSLPIIQSPAPGQEDLSQAVATVVFGMRHPDFPNKMRVGTAHHDDDLGDLPDNLDEHRDLPRYQQVRPEEEVRNAALKLAQSSLKLEDFDKFENNIDGRALIGDMRNDENLIIAQFHLSFLRFHNKAVDFLNENETGWIADFNSAQALTRLHYQWLITNQYLPSMCQGDVLQRVLEDKAKHFFDFRRDYDARLRANGADKQVLSKALPLEFSVAIYRFAHSMVRNAYDYNQNFGRPKTGNNDQATFNEMFAYTGNGGFEGHPRVPKERIIDWTRFLTADNSGNDGLPERVARNIDTELAPPLADLVNEGGEHPEGTDVRALLRHLAQRNLLRGYNLRLPTGQALHRHLKNLGAVNSAPIDDVSTLFGNKPDMQNFFQTQQQSELHTRTPLWFYCLAEAEAVGGNQLGEVGSWIVASTFVGVLLDDPDSALSREFEPEQSPLRVKNGNGGNAPIDSLEKWMKFALVLE